MKLKDVLPRLIDGGNIYRKSWNSQEDSMIKEYVYLVKHVDNKVISWIPNTADKQADDWI